MSDDRFEHWFVTKYGTRPTLTGDEKDLLENLGPELDKIREKKERQREWDRMYLVGRQALDMFAKREI
jgi:hypothetical protein